VILEVDGSGSPRTVTEQEVTTPPCMRIHNFNVTGVARSNFKPGIDTNPSLAILKFIGTIDVVSVCGGVNVPVVALRGVRGKRLQASASTRSPHACRAHHNVQGRRTARRRQPVVNRVTAHHDISRQTVLNNSLKCELTTRHTHLLLRGGSLLLRFLGGSSFRSLPSHVSPIQRDNAVCSSI
jgi:hypothetical protein